MRFPLKSRWTVAAGVTIIAAATVAFVLASGGDDDGASPDSPSSSVDAPTGSGESVSISEAIAGVRESSWPIELRLEVIGSNQGDQILTAEGLFAGATVSLDVDGSEAINEAGFYGEHDYFGAAFSGTGAFFEILPEDPEWLAVSLEEGSPTGGHDIGQLRDLSIANPNVLLELFKRVDAEGAIGPNEIDGEPMARFDIPVNMNRAWPSAVQPLADILLDDFGIEEMEVHLWVDAANQLRRIEESFTYAPNVEVSITIDFETEPADETPELPDESDVRTFEDLSG